MYQKCFKGVKMLEMTEKEQRMVLEFMIDVRGIDSVLKSAGNIALIQQGCTHESVDSFLNSGLELAEAHFLNKGKK